MKKICLGLCASLLFLNTYAAPSAEEIFESFNKNQGFFTDMDSHEWAKEAVDYLYENKMISGFGGGIFAPDFNVTRLEFIKMICTSGALTDKDASSDFEDVPKSSWGYEYVSSAKELGLIDIYHNADLGADLPISREDMAYIAHRAIRLFDDSKTSESKKFKDDEEIAGYAKDGVYYLKDLGIINGRGDGTFDPKGTATRAEAAKIIYNVSLEINKHYLKEN